jgi:hypothetical protein
MSASLESEKPAPSKATRIWMIVLQVLIAPGVGLSFLASANSIISTVWEMIAPTYGPLTFQEFLGGLFSGLGYLIPFGLNLAAWLIYRKRRGGLAIALMVFSLVISGCALVFIGFAIMQMLV